MIKAILIFNNHGKPRLSKFYEHYTEDTEQQIIRETFHLVSKRDENVCNFLEGGLLIGGSDNKLIYRHYATLYFVFVETLDKCFENVCELDLIFHMDKVHNILAEMVMGGMVLETNMSEIITQVEAQNKMEKSEAGIAGAPARAVSAVKNMNLPEMPKNINIGDISIKVPNLPSFKYIKEAVIHINSIDSSKFSKLLSRILQKLHLKAVYHNVKPPSLKQQLENIGVESEKAEVFSQVWASAGPDVVEKIRHGIFAPKKLDHVGWQLNLQMASSTRSKLKEPHAVLNLGLRTEDDTEHLQDVFVEFNHQDLLDFYNQMEMIQTQLDSLS
ncbi:AP-3 complex subunit sigma-1 isoform X1 [Labeo rohita]|uniref:AP-3 complex subunit sigma-1 isoform X1 n=1 Tax=Labeo rohita TaxID=84645 RepID=A0A498NA52_LABRO|nr:AP-3 complex subunit sigma-1 isoform X1 [Labeo rohita]